MPCAGLMPVGLDTAIIPSIPNNRTEIRRALKIDEHARVFIFVGRLDPYKQPLDLVPLLQAAPDWYAIIIGRGSLGDELTRRLTDAGLLDRCRLIPQLPNEQVHVYYHACDAFVNLNPNEIFGMSLLEAMYAGCPPVARHAPGPDLIIENGISGLLCGTVPELAAAGQNHRRHGPRRPEPRERKLSVAEQCRAGPDPAAQKGKSQWITTILFCRRPPTSTAVCALQ